LGVGGARVEDVAFEDEIGAVLWWIVAATSGARRGLAGVPMQSIRIKLSKPDFQDGEAKRGPMLSGG
jgi:hypothetical protein